MSNNFQDILLTTFRMHRRTDKAHKQPQNIMRSATGSGLAQT